MKLATFSVLSYLVLAQVGAPAPFVPGFHGISWDAPLVDTGGNPIPAPPKYDTAISLRTSDLAAGGAALRSQQVAVPQLGKVESASLTAGLAPGDYRVWVRGVAATGAIGIWSDPLLIGLSYPYGKASNLRVITFPGDATILIIPAGGTP